MSIDHYTAAGNYQNLFVAKLPLSVSNAELMHVFAPFSPSSATVMLDPVTGRSKGYAFVLFAKEEDGRTAAATLDKKTASIVRNGSNFSFNLTIFASKHSGKDVAVENECLYIRNIPNSWPMATVESFIAQHGKPVYSAVRSDHLGSPVWVVFVEYDSVESARNTLKALHGMVIAPRSPPILAKYAETDDVKKNRKERKTGRVIKSASSHTADESGAHTPHLSASSPAKVSPHQHHHRIDATSQMHRPCHATRYNTSNSNNSTDNLAPNAATDGYVPSPEAAPSTAVNSFASNAGSAVVHHHPPAAPIPISGASPYVAATSSTSPQHGHALINQMPNFVANNYAYGYGEIETVVPPASFTALPQPQQHNNGIFIDCAAAVHLPTPAPAYAQHPHSVAKAVASFNNSSSQSGIAGHSLASPTAYVTEGSHHCISSAAASTSSAASSVRGADCGAAYPLTSPNNQSSSAAYLSGDVQPIMSEAELHAADFFSASTSARTPNHQGRRYRHDPYSAMATVYVRDDCY